MSGVESVEREDYDGCEAGVGLGFGSRVPDAILSSEAFCGMKIPTSGKIGQKWGTLTRDFPCSLTGWRWEDIVEFEIIPVVTSQEYRLQELNCCRSRTASGCLTV
jgi:hypothetical protein